MCFSTSRARWITSDIFQKLFLFLDIPNLFAVSKIPHTGRISDVMERVICLPNFKIWITAPRRQLQANNQTKCNSKNPGFHHKFKTNDNLSTNYHRPSTWLFEWKICSNKPAQFERGYPRIRSTRDSSRCRLYRLCEGF